MLKKYKIPVTHTATVVVDHHVEAKNMQDAMFKVGQTMNTAPDPFQCVENSEITITTKVTPGTPEIVE